jgi:hypothetical protein
MTNELCERQTMTELRSSRALANGNGGGQGNGDIRSSSAVAVPDNLSGANWHRRAVGGDQSRNDNHARLVAADPSVPLRLAADTLNDVEQLRIATENRIRAMRDVPGWESSPAALRWSLHLAALADLERAVTRELEHAMRAHPLGAWVRSTVGLGLKQTGRLIGALGDPAWNARDERPRRGPAELWAFAGYAPGQRRRKGVRSNWNAEAKMRAYLIAESCLKQRHSPYRKVYDDSRAHWSGRDVSDGHAHNHALRLVAKAVLRDLWVEAMRIRSEEET